MTEQQLERIHYDGEYHAYAEVGAVSKTVSLDIDTSEGMFEHIPLKQSEAEELFNLVNEAVKKYEEKDIHDVIREIRKGAEREEPQKERLPESKGHDDYEPEL